MYFALTTFYLLSLLGCNYLLKRKLLGRLSSNENMSREQAMELVGLGGNTIEIKRNLQKTDNAEALRKAKDAAKLSTGRTGESARSSVAILQSGLSNIRKRRILTVIFSATILLVSLSIGIIISLCWSLTAGIASAIFATILTTSGGFLLISAIGSYRNALLLESIPFTIEITVPLLREYGSLHTSLSRIQELHSNKGNSVEALKRIKEIDKNLSLKAELRRIGFESGCTEFSDFLSTVVSFDDAGTQVLLPLLAIAESINDRLNSPHYKGFATSMHKIIGISMMHRKVLHPFFAFPIPFALVILLQFLCSVLCLFIALSVSLTTGILCFVCVLLVPIIIKLLFVNNRVMKFEDDFGFLLYHLNQQIQKGNDMLSALKECCAYLDEQSPVISIVVEMADKIQHGMSAEKAIEEFGNSIPLPCVGRFSILTTASARSNISIKKGLSHIGI